jgi:uncharacterized protein (DUF2141 family)
VLDGSVLIHQISLNGIVDNVYIVFYSVDTVNFNRFPSLKGTLMNLISKTLSQFAVASFFVAASFNSWAADGEVTVRVTNIASSQGEVGCALFPAGSTFPMDASSARQIWQKADAAGITCRFDKVQAGSWAVSVSHDLNGNRKVDTNFLGIPTEAWGVSNNSRPTLRAPKFEEAAFKVASGQSVTLDIKVDK